MHVLTKVFIVLVSLLAVLLVPLVVVYSQNEDNFKAKYETASSQADLARSNLNNAVARHGTIEAGLQTSIDDLKRDNADLQKEKTNLQIDLRTVDSKLVAAESLQTEVYSKIAILAEATKASQQIVNSLLAETRNLRSDGVSLREHNAEMDESLREVMGQLEVSNAATRALREEVQRLREEHGEAIAKISDYVAIYGDIEAVAVSSFGGIPSDVDLDAEILSVHRNPQGTYAEIAAGSRDGVKVGVIMMIYSGGKFIGNLRIEKVDINKSTGIVMLEDESRSGLVQVGHRVSARAGQ